MTDIPFPFPVLSDIRDGRVIFSNATPRMMRWVQDHGATAHELQYVHAYIEKTKDLGGDTWHICTSALIPKCGPLSQMYSDFNCVCANVRDVVEAYGKLEELAHTYGLHHDPCGYAHSIITGERERAE